MKYVVCWRLFRDQPTNNLFVASLEEAQQAVKDAAMQGVRAWISQQEV